jgi:hypothetical protein
MRAWLLAAAALVVGCYQPTFREGISCSANGKCPPEQHCDFGTLTCHVGPVPDAHPIYDAPTIDAPVDAFVQGTCTLWPQTGCQAGMKCSLVDNMHAETMCAFPGGNSVGNKCSNFGIADNCVAGAICVWGGCRQLCATSADCGADACVNYGYWSECSARCDALSPSCPATAFGPQNCYVNAGSGESYCVPSPSNQAPGTACTHENDCAAGVGCVAAVCRRYCDHATYPEQQAPNCATGEICKALSGNVGACELP